MSETQNRWLFEVWGPAGTLLEQELAEGWKVEGNVPRTQDEHYWAWGQTPAPHRLCAPLQSSASLPCSRQPAQKCLRLVHTALETPWSEGNMTLLHPHRCSSSSTCPSSAVCSGMRMRRFWPLSHLKCFAPQMEAGSKRYCAPLFTGSANGEDLPVHFLLNEWICRITSSALNFSLYLKSQRFKVRQRSSGADQYTLGMFLVPFFLSYSQSLGNCIVWDMSKMSRWPTWETKPWEWWSQMLGRACQTVWAPADGAENSVSLMVVLELVSRHSLAGGPWAGHKQPSTRKGKNSHTHIGSYPCGLVPKAL